MVEVAPYIRESKVYVTYLFAHEGRQRRFAVGGAYEREWLMVDVALEGKLARHGVRASLNHALLPSHSFPGTPTTSSLTCLPFSGSGM